MISGHGHAEHILTVLGVPDPDGLQALAIGAYLEAYVKKDLRASIANSQYPVDPALPNARHQAMKLLLYPLRRLPWRIRFRSIFAIHGSRQPGSVWLLPSVAPGLGRNTGAKETYAKDGLSRI